MKKLISMMVFLVLGIAVFAQTHIVQKGENLQSIATKYNVTVSQLIEANPGADKLFYVGLILNIPEAMTNTENPTPVNDTKTRALSSDNWTKELESQNSNSISPNDFGHVYINYSADPEFFDKGFYGIGYCMYNDSGFGGTFSAHGNWGIVDNGQIMFKFGPAYGYAVNQYLLVNASLRGFIYTYDKYNGVNATSTDQKVSGGITITPGVTFKLDKFFINAGFELGWAEGYDKLYKCIELGIGYKF